MLGARRVRLTLGAIVVHLAVGLTTGWTLTDHVPTTVVPPAPEGTFLALFQHSDNQVFPPYPSVWRDIVARTATLSAALQALPLGARLARLRAYLDSRARMEPQYGMLFSLEFNSDVLPPPQGVLALRPRVIQLVRRRVYQGGPSAAEQLVYDWDNWGRSGSGRDWLRHSGIMADGGWIVDGGEWVSAISSVPYYNWYRTGFAGLLQGFSDRQCIMWDTPGFTWSNIRNLSEGQWLRAEFQFQTYVVADAIGAIAGFSPHNALGYVEWSFTSTVYRGGSVGETSSIFTGVQYQWVDSYPGSPSPEYTFLIDTNYRAWQLTPQN